MRKRELKGKRAAEEEPYQNTSKSGCADVHMLYAQHNATLCESSSSLALPISIHILVVILPYFKPRTFRRLGLAIALPQDHLQCRT